jgi:hypothetical protein
MNGVVSLSRSWSIRFPLFQMSHGAPSARRDAAAMALGGANEE